MNTSSVQYSRAFKPVVGAAVNLDQFAKPGAALTHWVRAYRTASSGAPVARPNHQLAGTLDGQLNAVQLGEFSLASVGRSPVVCADELNGRRACGFIQPPV